MKNLFVITLLCFLIASCGNEAKTTEAANETSTAVSETVPKFEMKKEADTHDHDDRAGHDHDESIHIKADPLSKYLGIWRYYASSKRGVFKDESWIEFKADDTFEYGKEGRATNSGTWKLDMETDIMYLDFKDNTTMVDDEWKVEVNSPVMLMLGNTPTKSTGEQIKLDKMEIRPGNPK